MGRMAFRKLHIAFHDVLGCYRRSPVGLQRTLMSCTTSKISEIICNDDRMPCNLFLPFTSRPVPSPLVMPDILHRASIRSSFLSFVAVDRTMQVTTKKQKQRERHSTSQKHPCFNQQESLPIPIPILFCRCWVAW